MSKMIKMFKRWLDKIKNRVILFSLVMTVIPLMLLGYINIQSTKDNLMLTIHGHNMNAARIIAADLSLFIEHSIERVQLVIEAYEPITESSTDTQELVIYSLMKDMPEIEKLTLFNKQLEPICIVSKRDIVNLSDAMFTSQIERDVTYDPIYYASDGRPILSINVPIWDRVADTPLGIMKAHINLRSFIQNATDTDMSGYYYVIDSLGNLIGHQDFSDVLSNQSVKSSQAVKLILQGISPYAVNEPMTYETYNQTMVLGSYAFIPELQWGVVIEQPLQEALYPINQLYIRFGMATIIVSLIVASTSIFSVLRFTKPIEDLSKGATIIASGKLDHRIESKGNGEVAELIDSFNHMTEELRIKTADLIQEKQLLDKVVSGVGVGLALINDDCSLVWCNQQLYRWFQTEQQHEIEQYINVSIDECTTDDFDYTIVINNEKMHLRQRVFALEKHHPDDPKYLRMIEDITAKREMEAMVIQADKLAAVGLLASGVAHEINNPLHTINLYTEYVVTQLLELRDRILLGNEEDKFEDIINDLNMVKKQVTRCSHITGSLLNFSRQREMVNEPVDVNYLIQETISLLSYSVRKADITIQLELQEDIPYIECSAIHLQQVFFNLLQNSIDAIEMKENANNSTPGANQANQAKQLTVTTNAVDTEIVIKISDTGLGIDSKHLAKIFDPFFTTKEVGKGTGLGLSISYGIITQLQGTFQVASETGKGTTFTIRIPILNKNNNVLDNITISNRENGED